MKFKSQTLKIILFFGCIVIFSCKSETQNLDSIVINANIYPVITQEANYNAIGIKNGLISKLGNSEELLKYKGELTEVIDANNQFLMPGFIEGHGHYSALGDGLGHLNFLADTSWQQITEKVFQKMGNLEKGEWIYGGGWHQEKFRIAPEDTEQKYPSHQSISSFTEDYPVILLHASRHSLFANKKAMEIAGITHETPDPSGGKIIRNRDGDAIGVFEERAMKPIQDAYKAYYAKQPADKQKAKWKAAIKMAEQECLAKGITSFQDAGSKFYELEWYEEMAKNKELELRLWAMARHGSEELKGKIGKYRMEGVGDGYFTCRALKSELDGALGSHGAWLLEAYEDKPDFHGQNTTEVSELEAIAQIAYENNMQLCVHSIGDKANRLTLDIFEKYKKMKPGSDLRWRVEHAQHLHPDDIPRFKELGAIASMQGVHCTSDAPFVETRLGEKRSEEGAYAWRALLDAGAVVVNGTDAPVEDVNPLASFYASVTRKRTHPEMEFVPEQRMTRTEALYSYTLAPAYAAFEEDLKGSIEIGKFADFVILDKNLLTCPEDQILKTQILKTIVGGKIKYQQ